MADELIKKEFTQIYERDSDTLFRFCLWRVSDRETALELTQETFTRLWVQMASGGRLEYPRAFLYLVAKRLIIDWYRKSKPGSLEALSQDGEEPFDPADGEAPLAMETASDAGRVLGMLDRLSAEHREVIYLRFVEGLPPREISKILKISPNAVSVRLSRGLDALRSHLGLKIDKPE